jgi:hypothetical protein
MIFRGISYNARLSIGGRAIDYHPATMSQIVQKIILHLLVQQQLLMLHQCPSMTHTAWVSQPVALADKLQQPLDESGGHVLFNVVVSSALGPKWYRLRGVGQIVVEGLTMVERHNCIIATVDYVYGTPNKEFGRRGGMNVSSERHGRHLAEVESDGEVGHNGNRRTIERSRHTHVKSPTRSTFGNRSPMVVNPTSRTTRITDRNGLCRTTPPGAAVWHPPLPDDRLPSQGSRLSTKLHILLAMLQASSSPFNPTSSTPLRHNRCASQQVGPLPTDLP